MSQQSGFPVGPPAENCDYAALGTKWPRAIWIYTEYLKEKDPGNSLSTSGYSLDNLKLRVLTWHKLALPAGKDNEDVPPPYSFALWIAEQDVRFERSDTAESEPSGDTARTAKPKVAADDSYADVLAVLSQGMDAATIGTEVGSYLFNEQIRLKKMLEEAIRAREFDTANAVHTMLKTFQETMTTHNAVTVKPFSDYLNHAYYGERVTLYKPTRDTSAAASIHEEDGQRLAMRRKP